MNRQVQPYQMTQTYRPLQVEAQFWQEAVPFLITLAMGAWVISQLIKAFRGEEVERPF